MTTKQKFFQLMDRLSSVSTVSSFSETGKITPEEFVMAGDFLVENFHTWKWETGPKDKLQSHLPPQKQFLKASNVAVFAPMTESSMTEVESSVAEGWVEAQLAEPEAPVGDVDEKAAKELDDDDVPDADDFDYSKAAEEDTSAVSGSSIVKTRCYDLTIVYSVYYETPRMFLYGYDENHQPLKEGSWKGDFSPEHVNKTVTVEMHPNLGMMMPTIHPCRHAEAMKRMISLVLDSTKGALEVNYMVIFLKLIQSIIPNIEYDYCGEFAVVEASDPSSS